MGSTDPTTGQYMPAFQKQGPASNCIIEGKQLGWLSCSAYSAAHLEDRATRGKQHPSGCDERRAVKPKDLIGGLTLPQVASVLRWHNVDMEVHTGPGVCTPEYAMDQLHDNRAFILQGNTVALVGTVHQSTQGGVNHAIEVNFGVGWKRVAGHWRPTSLMVFDSAADARKRSYHVDKGPSMWPYERLLAFAAALRPWGDGDPRKLGHGKFYAGFSDPVAPAAIKPPGLVLFPGAERTKPYPDRTRLHADPGKVVRVWSKPSFKSKEVRSGRSGELFVAYQMTKNGQAHAGSRAWYGNKAGNQWVHSSRLSHEGGST